MTAEDAIALDPEESTDGEQSFSSPALFVVPLSVHVIEGFSGNGTAILTITPSIQNAGANVTCTYRGASAQEHPSTPEERAMAGFYVLLTCDSNVVAGQKLLVDRLQLHLVQGDSQAGTTTVQHITNCPEDRPAVVAEIPLDTGELLPSGWPEVPRSPGDPQPDPPLPPPLPYVPGSTPEINGVYVPVEDPSIIFVER